ncbi:RNA polymerase sigma factor [Fundidesulfovibrio terrae]|uniref:RNA polymerase sigma factor n=1 Tax=Fundidesulfovibrio terrae TaxID=2922866 RepID=UPI001FAF04C0|nr:sigma-70 family RNA polymerase sigma factor [Fundidesulfovibrio terrae]
MEDEQIIRLVQAGDSEAYAALVRRHHRELLGFIHRLVRDAHLAEDIGQEVFLAAYKALPRFDPDRGVPFAAWLCVIARNRCVSALRARGRTRLVQVEDAPELAADAPGMDARLIASEERKALAESLEKLDEPFKSTILLSLEGELVEDIACRMGVPASTIKTRLFRAREKLRRLFAASTGGICHERQL